MARSPYHPAEDELFWAVTCSYEDTGYRVTEEYMYVHEEREKAAQRAWDGSGMFWADRFPIPEARPVEIDLENAWQQLMDYPENKEFVFDKLLPENGGRSAVRLTIASRKCSYADLLTNERVGAVVLWPRHVLHRVTVPVNIDVISSRSEGLDDLLLAPRGQ